MASQPNFGLLGNAAQLSDVNSSIQNSLINGQNIQKNQNQLAQEQQQLDARKAMSDLILSGMVPGMQSGQAVAPAQPADPNAPAQPATGTAAVAPQQNPLLANDAFKRLAVADPQAAATLQAHMQEQNALKAYYANPTAAGTLRILTQAPELKEQLSKGWDVYSSAAKDAKLSLAADVYNRLQNGDAAGAADAVQQHYTLDKNAGLPTDGYEGILAEIKGNPKAALGHAGLLLATGAGPEKFAEAYGKLGENERDNQLQPGLVQKGLAEASTAQTTAQFAPQTEQSKLDTAASERSRIASQNATDAANTAIAQGRLTLDTNKLAAETNTKMAEIEATYGKQTPATEAVVNSAATDAAATQQVAAHESDLAARIRAAGLHSGPVASAAEGIKRFFGTQDQYTQMRNEWLQLKNQGMLAGAKGTFSRITNADLKLLNQGFPPPNANPTLIANFLDAQGRAHAALAQQNDDKASWAAANNGLGPLRRDTVIDGAKVPAGMTFAKYQALKSKLAAPAVPGDAAEVIARAKGQ